MNEGLLKGKWDRVKDKLKARWSELTDDDLQRVERRRDALAGVLEKRYSLPRAKAEADSKAFLESVSAKAVAKAPDISKQLDHQDPAAPA